MQLVDTYRFIEFVFKLPAVTIFTVFYWDRAFLAFHMTLFKIT